MEATPGKVNGIIKSPIFALIVGQVLAFLCWGLLAAVAWGTLSEQFKEEEKWRGEMDQWRKTVNMDGTDNFKYGHYEARLQMVEEASKKIDVILQSQFRMEESLKELKAQKK